MLKSVAPSTNGSPSSMGIIGEGQRRLLTAQRGWAKEGGIYSVNTQSTKDPEKNLQTFGSRAPFMEVVVKDGSKNRHFISWREGNL